MSVAVNEAPRRGWSGRACMICNSDDLEDESQKNTQDSRAIAPRAQPLAVGAFQIKQG